MALPGGRSRSLGGRADAPEPAYAAPPESPAAEAYGPPAPYAQPPPPPPVPPSTPSEPEPGYADPWVRLTKLRGMRNDGTITDAEFEEHKRRILSEI